MNRRCPIILLLLLGVGSNFVQAAEFNRPTEGYRLDIPEGWVVNEGLLRVGGPLSITNFPPAEYIHGGLLPPCGAEITVRRVKASDPEAALDALFSTPADAGRDVKRARRTFGGRLSSTAEDSFIVPEHAERILHVAFEIDGKVFLAHLRYRAGTGNRDEFERVLEEVVASVALPPEGEATPP